MSCGIAALPSAQATMGALNPSGQVRPAAPLQFIPTNVMTGGKLFVDHTMQSSIAGKSDNVVSAQDDSRGREAKDPTEIPARGWRDILLRLLHRLSEDNVTLVAGGIAFNALFALFPLLIVTLSLYGLVASPSDVTRELEQFTAMLPPQAANILLTQITSLAGRPGFTLGVGAVVSAAVTLYSSIQATWALTLATNIAYHQEERRSYLKLIGMSLLFTFGAVIGLLLLLALTLVVPLVLNALSLGAIATTTAMVLRWVLLWGFAVLALAVLYRYAPCRDDPQWRWVSWGSAAAATLWLGASLLFSLYVRDFGNYGKTYGALGGAVLLMMWFYLGSFAVLLGAELDAEMEHQTEVDTTRGPPQPMGKRGAFVADTVGGGPKQ